MPNINLRDQRNRDALVRAEPLSQTGIVRYVDKDGAPAQLRRVLKGTVDTGYEALLAAHEGDADKLGAALIASDPEIDVERTGMFLMNPSRVWVGADSRIVYRIVKTEVVRGPDGMERERRPKKRQPSNIDTEIPLTWTGRKIKRADALTRFVFFQKLQIVHVNGLTYDFLYGIAKELAEADSLMLLGAGKSGKEPLIIRHGSTPARGFLEGRIDGDRYVLLLHLSKMELKRPEPVVVAEVQPEAAVATAATAPSPQPVPAAEKPADPAPAPTPQPMPVTEPAPLPVAASPSAPEPASIEPAMTPTRKPSVADVLAATAEAAPALPTEPVKEAIGETVQAAKAAKRRAKTPKADAAAPDAPAQSVAKPARKRAPRATPAAE